MKRSIPRTPEGWLLEIRLAIKDAREIEQFSTLTGERITDANLFHLAPLVCLKFRGTSWWVERRIGSRKRHWRTTSSTPIPMGWTTVLNQSRCWRLLSVT